MFLKKQQIKSFEESEKKEESKLKLKSLATQEAKEGKRPHFINKSKSLFLPVKRIKYIFHFSLI